MTNNMFLLSLADIFSVYPQIFNELVADQKYFPEIYLPSDTDWQDKMYYMLLEVQKNINEALDSGKNYEDVIRKMEKPTFDSTHIQRFSPATSPSNCILNIINKCERIYIQTNKKVNVCWTLDNICKAAQLLKNPSENIVFTNEHDMRIVYSLIYDVFRYKLVLTNVLCDIKFFEKYPEYSQNENLVWLMLYELNERAFQQRSSEDVKKQNNLYKQMNIKDLADSLWTSRTKLAASISRMRIKYGALQLSQLLPIHLQNEKVAMAATSPVVTGWINPFLIRNKDTAEKLFYKYGFTSNESVTASLKTSQFKWDTICPLFLSCIPTDRSEFTKSDLVVKNYFIIQDRTFALGPAVMARLLDYFDLNGDILQTHVDSPRSTAYLAALYYSVNRLNNFYVYGSGSNLKIFRKYMEDLSINNIRIFADSFTSFPLESNSFRTVVGIFANPPNSCSSISDPIDLICSRGGDLGMLKILTESSLSDKGRQRVSLILEEQLQTLRMAMSRPQIQFLLYQTHSVVASENHKMVEHIIEMINKTALKKHRDAFFEQKRLESLEEAEAANVPSAAMKVNSPRKQNNKQNQNSKEDSVIANDNNCDDVKLPEIDEFIRIDIPDLCKNQDNCLQKLHDDCFLSLIQRKKITRLNAKFLIQTAEKRGLFGKAYDSKTFKSKQLKSQEFYSEFHNPNILAAESMKNYTLNTENLVARLGNPTNASTIHWISSFIINKHTNNK
ncbi:putative methyltransferase NSUN7 [Cochliomyia hominivorax]